MSLCCQSLKNDYTPIKSKGFLPDDFFQTTSKRSEEELLQSNVLKNRKHQKIKNELIVNSNYELNKLFQNAYVLINDTISNYVNKIASIIIDKNPSLKSKLKIYVIKSTELNAYCFENGVVFLNLGLIAHLHNEAELAFILCHEFTHFTKQHSLQLTINQDSILSDETKKRTFEDKVLLLYKHSRENETEADTGGYCIFKRTNYDLNQTSKALDVLKYFSLPFDSLYFDKSIFEGLHYKLPDVYFLKEFNPIKEGDYDDSYVTHPNIPARKKQIELLIKNDSHNSNERKTFLVSEDAFNYVREIARFECLKLFLMERDYISSLKWGLILKSKYPDNRYVNEMIGKCLYALTLNKVGKLTYVKDSYHSNAIPDYTKVDGSSQQVNYFFYKLPPNELSILTLRFLWQNKLKYPEDDFFLTAIIDISKLVNLLYADDLINIENTTTASTIYYYNAFMDLDKAEDFLTMLKQGRETEKRSENTLKTFKNLTSKKELRTNGKNAFPLNKVLIINPEYDFAIDYKKRGSYQVRTEEKKQLLIRYLEKNLQSLKIDYDLLDPTRFDNQSIEKYNQYGELNSWLNERFDIGLDNANRILGTDHIEEQLTNYGTRYLLLTSVTSIKHQRSASRRIFSFLAWAIYIVPIPAVIYLSIKPNQDINISLTVMDLKTGEIIKAQTYKVHHADSEDLLNSYIFDFLNSFKNVSSKKI
jgi:hypothetical protein